MKKFLFILGLLSLSILGFSQSQTIPGDKIFTGGLNITGLSGDNTEEYIIAIDNTTGLLSKRSVASIEGSERDSVVIDSVARVLSDTATFPFGLGAHVAGDTAWFVDDAYIGGWRHEQDTCNFLMFITKAYGNVSASVSWRVVYADSIDHETPTVIASGTAINAVDTLFITDMTNNKVPPNKKIWGELNGNPSTGEKATFLEVDSEFAYTRHR